MAKTLHPSTTFSPGALRLVLGGGLGQNKVEGEREDEQDHKKRTEENSRGRGKRREKENAIFCKSSAPDLINSKQNQPLSHNPLIPAPAEKRKNKRQKKEKKLVTDYYPPSPIYVPSYKEEASTLVKNLVPESTLKGKRLLQIEET